ncbi:hypothetical protein CTAM01_03822 [Colletotrichum tamarilloi]|uniref:Uncharacterized protein n=1 Tax=Colletotrichum tamarilloi TaxID=1209934 RepID=A0ABQ9RJ54_9PEZI|nr:uncharacterized protein CTAM01_03822 [Colletotrichum tamarilloi]KAK1504515.1 hypothetical protein CTAM01_03822 [Colletotrichum tamarilloi]
MWAQAPEHVRFPSDHVVLPDSKNLSNDASTSCLASSIASYASDQVCRGHGRCLMLVGSRSRHHHLRRSERKSRYNPGREGWG